MNDRREVRMTQRTRFLARLFGLFLLCLAVPMAVNRGEALTAIGAIVRAPDLLFTYGMIALVIGLSIVLTHNVWKGGAVPVIVSAVGWLMLARAVVLLFLPVRMVGRLYDAVRFADLYYGYVVVILVLGLYLTYSGFRGGEGGATAA
jgi:hypothetical protein